MKIIKAREMKEIDQRASSDFGIPSLVLMENAGLRTLEIIEEILGQSQGKKVLILAGKGNNGGDGMVVARHLMNSGALVEIFLLGREDQLSSDALINYRILQRMGAKIYPLDQDSALDVLMSSLLSSDLAVDALYGIGFQGRLNDFEARIVKILNWSRVPVVAVDIPSGVEADTGKVNGEAVRAVYTVTFALPKLGLLLEPGREYVGALTVADISIPQALLCDPGLKTNLINETLVHSMIRPRRPDSHKGSYGHVLVIGGSLGMTGAVMMASYAALRSGAGLVTAALPETLLPIVAGGIMEIMTTPLAATAQDAIGIEALPAIENLLGTASICAIGPGMSRYPEARAIVRFVLEHSGIPVIIDADGLNALQGEVGILKKRQIPLVLTPHPGEMSRLSGKSIEEIQTHRMEIACNFAQEYGVTLVLKGHQTLVATPGGEVYLNLTGNPGMATAGSGDVLCGMIAGLAAQGLRPQDAAIAGVYLHGAAGDLGADRVGQRGLVAVDLINDIPEILKPFEESRLR
ncbi:MAG TPA: NAD(P)H-hydrate dehydratase [Syntrophomonadaceae bacterium]|nr:NAD(P)H-hydrate dehydratase [Syntrophomonadaceae bacterium]